MTNSSIEDNNQLLVEICCCWKVVSHVAATIKGNVKFKVMWRSVFFVFECFYVVLKYFGVVSY